MDFQHAVCVSCARFVLSAQDLKVNPISSSTIPPPRGYEGSGGVGGKGYKAICIVNQGGVSG